jgi:hypothetical protein
VIDGTFVEQFKDAVESPSSLTIAGDERVFLPKGWVEVKRPDKPGASALTLHSLTGLVDYLVRNPDQIMAERIIVHVQEPTSVLVRGALENEENLFRRLTFARASTELMGPPSIAFGTYMDAETFYIGLQSGFVDNAGRNDLLTLIASIREGTVRETNDDGVAQEVKTARGVTLLDRTKVMNPHVLKPYRTFREIDQPPSTFVLRLQGDPGSSKPKCALFEAEGGRWKLEAMVNIAEYLKGKIPDTYHVIA